MKKLFSSMKHNLYLVLAVVLLSLSVIFGVTALGVLGLGEQADETSVGFIYLGSVDESQYQSILLSEINEWKNLADYRFQFQEYELELDFSKFDFDVQGTIANLQKDGINPAFFTLSDANRVIIEASFETEFSSAISDAIDYDALLSDILDDMGNLTTKINYALTDYLNPTLLNSIINSTTLSGIVSTDVDAIIQKISSIIIDKNQRFSLLSSIDALNLTNEQMSIVASAIQNITMNTLLTGFIFTQYDAAPAWSEAGKNVRILRVNQFDMSFYNPLDYDLTIQLTKIDATSIKFELTGYPFISTISTVPVFQTLIPFETIYIENLTINATTAGVVIASDTLEETVYELTTQTGVQGTVAFYIRTVTKLGGTPESMKLYEEQVPPVNTVIQQNIVPKDGD